MMFEWEKGNRPQNEGLFWVTVNEAGSIKMYDEPMQYKGNGIWLLNGGNYYSSNIIAFMRCNKPSEPYSEMRIGYPDQYYLRVTRRDGMSFLSKGFQPVSWSKIGYTTKEKAYAALRRYKKSEMDLCDEEFDVAVVNGNSEEV